MNEVTFLKGPLSQFKSTELKTLASDICKTLDWPVSDRSLVHLFPLGITSTNLEAVYHWLKCRHQSTTVPVTYRELCTLIYNDLKERHLDWGQQLQQA